MGKSEFVGREEIVGDDVFVGREEIVGSTFVGDADGVDGDGFVGDEFVGGTLRLSHALATDLPHKAGETSYALVAGRHGIEFLGKPAVALVGRDGRRARHAWREGQRRHRQLLRKAEAQGAVDAREVDAVVGCANRARLLATGRPMTRQETQRVKSAVLSDLSDRNAVVNGSCVSGMGDWISSIMSVPGTVVSKGLELGTRLAIGTDKALLMAPFNAVKDTFFKKKKKKAATPAAAAAAASSPDNLSAMAQRIAQRRAEYQDRMAELRSRISLADAKQQLAQQEADEEARLAELEAEAAQKEADAAVALRGADIGGDAGAEALRRWAALRGEAVEQRIAAATIKTAGPFAKAMIMNSPLGKLFSFASQVYKEARTDPNAGAKIARLKAAADQGHPDAQKAIGMLALGKAATADAAAAQTVNRELAQQATAAAASSSGADYEPGLVPSSKRLIKAVPGADQVYDLARSGNATALSSVRRAAELVRAAEAGDESARSKIAMLGKLAAGGDKSARVVLAAIAVATAGIRESDQAARVRGDGPAPKRAEKKPEAPAAADAPVRPTFAEKGGVGRLFKDLFGAHGPAYEQGLMLKLSQR